MAEPTQQPVSGAEQPKDDPRERALINRFQNAIESTIEDNDSRRNRNKELAKYVRGVQGLEDETKRDLEEVRANLILGIMQTLVPLYYAKDPEIDVSPEEQVQDVSYGALDTFCRTLQIVLNRLFIRNGELKRRITRTILSAMTNGVAWLKRVSSAPRATPRRKRPSSRSRSKRSSSRSRCSSKKGS